jgi:hypothetical protein
MSSNNVATVFATPARARRVRPVASLLEHRSRASVRKIPDDISITKEVKRMPIRKAEAEWKGNFIEGASRLRLGSGAFEGPYSLKGDLQGAD